MKDNTASNINNLESLLEPGVFAPIFRAIFSDCGLVKYISEVNIDRFYTLYTYMYNNGKKINVTSISDPTEVICKHFADSVTIAALLPRGASVIDVGTGGGFPSLPLAIVRDDLKITAIDSTAKKIRYVEEGAKSVGTANFTAISGRAEEMCAVGDMRETFDVAVSRAVASMPVLCELCLPFVRVGGLFIAMKGPAGDDELHRSESSIIKLGGTFTKKMAYDLHMGEKSISHSAFILQKVSSTPIKFPRNFAQINKKPL